MQIEADLVVAPGRPEHKAIPLLKSAGAAK